MEDNSNREAVCITGKEMMDDIRRLNKDRRWSYALLSVLTVLTVVIGYLWGIGVFSHVMGVFIVFINLLSIAYLVFVAVDTSESITICRALQLVAIGKIRTVEDEDGGRRIVMGTPDLSVIDKEAQDASHDETDDDKED